MKTRRIDKPEPSLFKLRLVKKGPLVAAKISFENGIWFASVNGEDLPGNEDYLVADRVNDFWMWGEFITQEEYDFMIARYKFHFLRQDNHPMLTPEKAIFIEELPPVF